MNLRPSGYEPDELPGCSTPRQECLGVSGASAAMGGGAVVRGRIGVVSREWCLRWAGLAATDSPVS